MNWYVRTNHESGKQLVFQFASENAAADFQKQLAKAIGMHALACTDLGNDRDGFVKYSVSKLEFKNRIIITDKKE